MTRRTATAARHYRHHNDDDDLQIDNVAVICQRAQEHIHTGECILTYGYSKIVEQFLKAAGAKRKFQVSGTLQGRDDGRGRAVYQ
jgi:translation initiation factor 2B subunit (eIF-2B alpha/beta/delta family)